MKKRMRALMVPFVAVSIAMSGCSDDDDPMGNGGDPPPDLSGTYSLQSFQSVLTGGLPLAPPIVTGTFTLTQTNVTGSEATGTLSVDITVPDGMGGTNQLMDQGTFTIRSDGSWEQTGQLQQGSGTFTLVGNLLTVNVTEPATAVSTSTWQRQ